MITRPEAVTLLEDVLDTLVEVGNGITEEDLKISCDKLFKFRNEYFKQKGDFNPVRNKV